ncbi:MAG TPA: hypothetical protein VFQ41_19675 [Candidatus Angelobacter sp.]|nr:hypothetical protein [Candidatus Angelobacter sp.]
MAGIQHKHSPSRAQGSGRSAHALTKPAHIKSAITKTQSSTRIHLNPKKRKRERVPESLRFTETKRGKTTVRRYSGRTFYRFEEVKGKTVDLVEVFTAGEYHSIDVRFEDKTALHFVIDPGFTLETEYADWKTGNWRPIKRWPLIHSETHR